MARKEIGTKWDRVNRNNMNDNFKELYNKSNSTQKQIDELVLNEGESHLEVVQARIDSEGNSYRTLKERLDTEHDELNTKIDGNHDEVTSQLAQKANRGESIEVSQIDKNKGKLDQTFMSDEFLQQMAGDTPINALPADDSLTTEKYVDGSVTREKLSPIVSGFNNYKTVVYYEAGKPKVINVTDGSFVLSRTELFYSSSGNLEKVQENVDDKIVTTTLNYNTDGVLTSTSNATEEVT